MKNCLSLDTARAKIDFDSLEQIRETPLKQAFIHEQGDSAFLPLIQSAYDMSAGITTHFSPSRTKRPIRNTAKGQICPICEGTITRIVDLYLFPETEDEFCFINKNLYPLVFPFGKAFDGKNIELEMLNWGFHFLFWPSNKHDRRIENMETRLAALSLQRLALLEKKMLQLDFPELPQTARPCFAIIKNEGNAVGGSIAHDHFQAAYLPLPPQLLQEDISWFQKKGHGFSEYLMDTMQKEQLVLEKGNWLVFVPPYMRRPGDLLICHRNPGCSFFHQLSFTDLKDLVEIMRPLPASNRIWAEESKRPPAFNFLFHNSGKGPFYLEFRPDTQALGGFEKLGLFLCQGSVKDWAEFYSGQYQKS